LAGCTNYENSWIVESEIPENLKEKFLQNTKKTYYVPYPFLKQNITNKILKIYNKHITVSNQIRYLGFYFRNNAPNSPIDFKVTLEKIQIKINLSMVKFLNKFGSIGLQFLDTCNRCFFMFTYSQADWNLQILPICNNNNFFCN